MVEPNGSITTAVMPAGDEDAPLLPLLIDRTVYRDNLAFFGLDETALDRMLETQNTSRRDVLLLLYNGEKTVLIPKKTAPEGTV